jgi:hypothetical protein
MNFVDSKSWTACKMCFRIIGKVTLLNLMWWFDHFVSQELNLRHRLTIPTHFGSWLSEISTMVLKVLALVLIKLKTKQKCWSIKVVVGWQINAHLFSNYVMCRNCVLICENNYFYIMHINFSQTIIFWSTKLLPSTRLWSYGHSKKVVKLSFG